MKSTLLVLCLVLITLTTAAQTKIKGTVSDDLGQLPLVNIAIKNSKTGTFSNDDGRFFIEAKPKDTLQFSYLGYKTKEVVVGDKMKIDLLFDSYEELDEVLINAHAGTTSCSWIICRCRSGCDIEDGSAIGENLVRKNDSETIKLYPNPSKDGIFNMGFLQDVQDVNIIVADLTGRIILNRTEHEIKSNISVDLSNQSSGIYIINVSSNGTQIASKKAIRM
jgi:hypothetical protein